MIKVGFTFILERKDSKGEFQCLKKVVKYGNEEYLIKNDRNLFPLLSEFELIDQDAFGSSFMPQLIKELEMVISQLDNREDIKHLEEVIEMAKVCQDNEDMVLISTPFGDHYE